MVASRLYPPDLVRIKTVFFLIICSCKALVSLEILGRFLAGFGRSNIGFDKVCINNTALYENDIGPTKILR